MSAAPKGFFAVARVLAMVASALGGIGAVCGLAVFVGGQFQCARRALTDGYQTGAFIGLVVLSAFIAAAARRMADERDGRIREALQLDNRPVAGLAQLKVFYAMFVILLTIAFGLAGIAFGIVLSITPLWALLTGCMMA
jgi:hypothetical protein